MKYSKISFIIPLLDAQKSRKAGCKAVNLSKLVGARFDVPRGFVISADAHSFHLWSSGIRNMAASLESPEQTRAAILNSEIPADIWTSIADAYHRLSLQLGFENPNLVVRSSVEAEQSAPAVSCLNVSGEDALKAAIKEIWASAWSDEAIAARAEGDLSEPAVAIIVQQLLEGAAKGRVYTAEPANGDPLNVVIECDQQEGSASFKVDLKDFKVTEGADNAAIDEADALRLAEQAILAESVIGFPVKIEWLFEGNRFWVLQADVMQLDTKPDDGLVRVSDQPVSHMARRLFWQNPRENADVCLKDGHVFSACAKELPEPTKAWQPAAEKSLEKWRKEAPELDSKSAAIIGKDLTAEEYPVLLELLAEAAKVSSRTAWWIDQMRVCAARFCGSLKKSLGQINNGGALYEKMICGLPCASFMRDAKLQDFGDRLSAAEQSGKLTDEQWWKSYRDEVKSFAAEYGYSFKSSGEMWDPAAWKSWVEDLDSVFRMIGAVARRGGRPSLVALHCTAEESAAQAEKEATELVAEDKNKFKKTVQGARDSLCAKNQCEQSFALACTALRLVAMEIGRRLCESDVIAQPEDVFHLAIDEVKAICQPQSEEERAEMVARIARRKHEYWLESRVVAARSRSTEKTEEGFLKGVGIGQGSISGRAKIVRSIEEAGDIEAGDIMVIEVPRLAWTPFLGVAGGLIAGGRCLECASYQAFMKDYDIPAVTGCEGVLTAIHDGQRIIVNGSDGTVDLCKS